MAESYKVWNSWSNMADLLERSTREFDVESGQGRHLVLRDGTRVLDGSSGLWTVNLGYGRRDVLGAIGEQMAKLPYLHPGSTLTRTRLGNELAERLLERLPGFAKVMYHCTGTAAVEASLLVLRCYFNASGQHQRQHVITLEGSYHGASLLAFSMAGLREHMVDRYGPMLDLCHHLPVPKNADQVDAAIAAAERVLEQWGEQSVAFVFEPVMATNATTLLPGRWLDAVIRSCRRHGVAVVADEVVTGLGRTGCWYASADRDVDVVLLGKGLGAGYLPIAASLYRPHIAERFHRQDGLSVDTGSTMDALPSACAGALAVVQALEREELVARAGQLGRRLLGELKELEQLSIVREVRGEGLMIGVELCHPSGEGPLALERVFEIHRRLIGAGLLSIPAWNTLSVSPAFTLTDGEREELVSKLAEVLRNEQSRMEGR